LRFDVYTADPNGSKRLLAWGQHVSASLDEATHALIETRVSQINGCAVCLMMHADAARRAGVPQDKLDALAAWRDNPSFTDRERAGLELAEAMTRLADGGRVSDDTWHQARDHFDDSSLAALVQVIAVINAFNRINIATERSADEYAAYRATAGA
jgi:AhpD family alkylhydroperoxidase